MLNCTNIDSINTINSKEEDQKLEVTELLNNEGKPLENIIYEGDI